MSSPIFIISVVLAEVMLSLYPIIVKSISVNLFTHVFARVLTYTIISSLFTSYTFLSVLKNPRFILISLLNLFHIYTSYYAFKHMNAGVAMTIFYIYPLFNLIFRSIITKQNIKPINVFYTILCIMGVFFISFNEMTKNNKPILFIPALISIILAALSESLIYTFYKSESKENPFDGIFTLYLMSSIVMLLFAPKYLELNGNAITILIIFNILIGLIGHVFRFYGIPRTTTIGYSVALFTGVISAYLFGWYFLQEKITSMHIIGTIMIITSIFLVLKEYKKS